MNKYKDLYDSIDFKNRETIKTLLYHKPYFDKADFISSSSSFNRIEPNQNMYLDLIDIYTDLDNIIEECNFSAKNKRLLQLIYSGYTISYIYINFENYNESATKMMFNRMLDKISEQQRQKEEEERNNDYSTSEWRGEKIR